MMARIVKSGLLLFIVFGVVWTGTIFYWTHTTRMPSANDIVACLLVLPLTLLGVYFLLKKVRSENARSASQTSTDGKEASSPSAGATAYARHSPVMSIPRMAVLATALRTSRGDSAEAAAGAIVQAHVPELAPRLRNRAGFQVLAGSMNELETPVLRERLGDMLGSAGGALGVDSLPDDRVRASYLLFQVLQELLTAAKDALLHAGDALAVRTPGRFVSSGEAMPGPAVLPNVGISLLLPQCWSNAERAMVMQWVRQFVDEAESAQQWTIESEHRPSTWAMLDGVHQSLHRHPETALWVAVAADSAISSDCVAFWETEGWLHSSTNRNGRIPGEGASGMLLARTGDAFFLQPHSVLLSMAPPATPDVAGNGGNASGIRLLSPLVKDLLSTSDVQAAAVGEVVSDADHRADKVMEIAEVMRELLPHLGFEASLATCATLGYLGAAADMTAAVLACHLAARDDRPVLSLSVQASDVRTAMLVGPVRPIAPSTSK